ncbi:hypothetical protein D3C84_905160 [compost metagenome]
MGALRDLHRQVHLPVNLTRDPLQNSLTPSGEAFVQMEESDESGNLAAVQRRCADSDPDPGAAVVADDQQQSELRPAPLLPGLSRRRVRIDLPAECFGAGPGCVVAGIGTAVQCPEDAWRPLPVLPRLAELAAIAPAFPWR